MKPRSLISIAFIIISIFIFLPEADAQIRSRKKIIEDLTRRLDSLQNAYDSLSFEYNLLAEPVSGEVEDEVNIDVRSTNINYSPEEIDSLRSVWYLHKQAEAFNPDFEMMERDTLKSSIPDSVYIERLNRLNSFIPIQFNHYVRNNIILYTEKMPKVTANIISLSNYYLPIIEGIFDMYDLPKELKAMAMIESAFNPKAVSRARARGMWQFMHYTARQYGLEMTSFVDERYDPYKSCHAAARYLKDSYSIFGDWSLAIASYNCGAGNVLKAIRRSGGKTDFWEIYNYLPRETRGYVPIFFAALYTLKYYPEHGIVPQQSSLPAHVDTIHVNKMLHFQQVSDVIDIPVEELRQLNPQYLHDIIPGKEKTYILRLPHNYTMQFVNSEDSIYSYKDTLFFSDVAIKKVKAKGGTEGSMITHTVRSGETLGGIARRYRTTVSNIKRWNNLRSDMIRVGQKLRIGGSAASTRSSSSTKSSGSTTKTTTKDGYVTYTVKKNDTLSGIASKFSGVTLSSLLQLNGFTKSTKIYPGMVIKIKKAQ
ncbi:MAG: LysM peptidoglycan-binding domain-containing protein [Bacteroidales bacterium]|nr:LysM peptidoglycan-binding domain-containing protein [Bacteroidales bacterium]